MRSHLALVGVAALLLGGCCGGVRCKPVRSQPVARAYGSATERTHARVVRRAPAVRVARPVATSDVKLVKFTPPSAPRIAVEAVAVEAPAPAACAPAEAAPVGSAWMRLPSDDDPCAGGACDIPGVPPECDPCAGGACDIPAASR
jgi:hypothetical protein